MKHLLALAVLVLFALQPAHAETIKINLHSCCVTEDATTKEILPAFRKYYKEKFGKDVDISASFAGSGTLKNQILGGAPVQVAVLSSELYLDQLKEKGLISSDWRKNPNRGAVIKSVIVFVTRKGNPKGLATFEDLARALAVSPSLLLLDEPLSALDIKVRERLRREIAAVQKKVGITTLIVTHDQEEAMELGDRIAVMGDGRIEQVASPREVYQEPATEFVAKFIGEVNILPGQLYRGSAYAGNLAIRMADRLSAGDTVRVAALRGSVLPDPLGAKEPEYFL